MPYLNLSLKEAKFIEIVFYVTKWCSFKKFDYVRKLQCNETIFFRKFVLNKLRDIVLLYKVQCNNDQVNFN
jgi:hypothetical protein